MTFRRLVPCVLTSLLASTAALAITPSSSRIEEFGPGPFAGEASGASARLLPSGVTGLLPEADGEPFALAVETGLYSGRDARSVRAALAAILPAVGFRGDVDALEIGEGTLLASPDADEVAAARAAETEALLRAIEAEHGTVTEATRMAIEYQADENEALMLAPRTVVKVVQSVGGRPIRGFGIAVRVDGDGYITGLAGALTDVARLAGDVRIDGERAAAIASDTIGAYERVTEVGAAEALAIATKGELRPAWRVEVTTSGRWYALVVDAETGEVVEIANESLNFSSGEGRAFTPNPFGSDYVATFEVNDAVSDKFVLAHSEVATVTNFGGDGCDTDPVSVSASGGYANFNVSPLNSITNVSDSTAAGYNCRFQEINAYARVYETLGWLEGLGAEPSPHVPVRVNLADACGDGADQACAGGGKLTLGVGSGTLAGGNMGLLNTALDQTVITHEIGHHVYSRQLKAGGGVGSSSLSEGLSDYFAMAQQDKNTVGEYFANSTSYVQSGSIPRQAEGQDVFPEHFDLGGNEAHANGQMAAYAHWTFRTEMGDRSALGEGLATRILLGALTCSGHGQTNVWKTEMEVYRAFQSLLACELLETGYTQARVDVLQSWARVGVFPTAHEAVIDISDDYLSPDDGPPSFTVWAGEDFEFDLTTFEGVDATDYNPYYEVELANDADFTVNPVSSGTLTFFGKWSGNTRGGWTPSQAQWDTLKEGSLLYYRVRTWNAEGQNERDSESTLAGFMQVPTAVAVINGGGSAGCSTTGGSAVGLVGALAGLAALRRRRS